jgi:hypothetical protein
MKYTRYFAGCALAVGLFAAGTRTASAQDWRYEHQTQDQYGNPYYRQDNGNGYYNAYGYNNSNGYTNTYDRIEELQQHIAHDHAKLNEAIRCGDDAEAARQAADLARDQRALHDLQYGQNAGYYNRPSYNRGWSFRFGWR